MANNAQKYNDLTLERFLLGELPEPLMHAIRNELETDASLAERIAQMEAFNESFAFNYPVRDVLPVKTNLKQDSSWSFRAMAVASFLTAAVGVNVFLNQVNQSETQIVTEKEETRLKGIEPQLKVYRKRSSEVELLKQNDFAKAHDILQVKYNSAGYRYGVIFSVDGNGQTSLHFPASVNGSTELEGGEANVPFAYELDSAPAFERFFLVVSSQPLDAGKILREAERYARQGVVTAQADVPFNVEKQVSFVVRKTQQ